MRGKALLVLGLIVGLAVTVAVASLARSALRPQPKAAPPPPVAAVPSEITLQGKVQARTVVNIPAPVEGTLERMLVDVGDPVYEGQVLASIRNARLDATAEAVQADQAKAQTHVADLESASVAARLEASRARADATRSRIEFDQAEKNYLRQKMLVGEGATPRLVFEKAERDYNSAKDQSESLEALAQKAEEHVGMVAKDLESARKMAQMKSEDADEAKAELAGAEVHSTVDGIVAGRRGQAGDAIDRSMRDLFEIATNLNALQVLVTPDSKVLPSIKPGQAATVLLAEAVGGVPGSVREIKAGQVFVDFASPAATVKPGLTAQVKIKIG